MIYFEPALDTVLDPRELVIAGIEAGAGALLLDASVLEAAFFDLSTGVAGELLHNLSKYQMRLAAVVPDPEAHSEHFQDFLHEANRGGRFRFFPNRQAAVDWLSTVQLG